MKGALISSILIFIFILSCAPKQNFKYNNPPTKTWCYALSSDECGFSLELWQEAVTSVPEAYYFHEHTPYHLLTTKYSHYYPAEPPYNYILIGYADDITKDNIEYIYLRYSEDKTLIEKKAMPMPNLNLTMTEAAALIILSPHFPDFDYQTQLEPSDIHVNIDFTNMAILDYVDESNDRAGIYIIHQNLGLLFSATKLKKPNYGSIIAP